MQEYGRVRVKGPERTQILAKKDEPEARVAEQVVKENANKD